MEKFIHKDFIKQELEFSEFYRYLDQYGMEEKPSCITGMKKNKNVRMNHTIWVFWNHGLERAPKLVRKCYESICRNKPEDFDIILLSDKTINEYISLPDYIWEKHEKGYMAMAHLSDVMRVELLCMYGGCWIDATVFLSGKIPEYMFSSDLFMFQFPTVLSDPVVKMSNWWIASKQQNRLIHLTRDRLFKYWECETDVGNYFLFHIIMSKLIDEDWQCRNIFDGIPYFNSGNCFVLSEKLGEEYREEEWHAISDASRIHKLTYKNKYLQGDIYNYYSALLTDGLIG